MPKKTDISGLSGKLIIFEGADGVGKSTQAKKLKRYLQGEGVKVKHTQWKSGRFFKVFFEQQQLLSRKKVPHPRATLMLHVADLLYRIEKEVLPALKKGKTVILDRSVETVYVRGFSIGLTQDQIKNGLLWPIEHVYKELFDKATFVYFHTDASTALKRLQERTTPPTVDPGEGTIIGLYMLSSLTYGPDGSRMTLSKKRKLIKQIQKNTTLQYEELLHDRDAVRIETSGKKKEVFEELIQKLT